MFDGSLGLALTSHNLIKVNVKQKMLNFWKVGFAKQLNIYCNTSYWKVIITLMETM